MSEKASRAEKVPSTSKSGSPDEKPSASMIATRRSARSRQSPPGALNIDRSPAADRISRSQRLLNFQTAAEETVKGGDIAAARAAAAAADRGAEPGFGAGVAPRRVLSRDPRNGQTLRLSGRRRE